MHHRPPAASTTPPSGREPVLTATAKPAIKEAAAIGAVGMRSIRASLALAHTRVGATKANNRLDIIYGISNPAELIRSTRKRLGLSQRRLALRAGTTQAAISRIERGLVSPTYTTLHELLGAMGEEPVLGARRMPTDWDPAHMASTLARTPDERLVLALSWNKMAGRLAEAGRRASEDG
jgi:transcriptional regulator with XRE-family HTH domain